MSQAILTRFLPCTDHKPSRIVAECQALRIVLSWEDSWDVLPNHEQAAKALIDRLGWASHGSWVAGQLKSGAYAHVLVSRKVGI